jgi:hypothetical protein
MASGAAPANLIFPSGTDTFSTKLDRDVVISGESHTIPGDPGPYELFLDYVPLQASPSTITIPGYVEVSGTPATFEFNTVYSGSQAGLLTFNSLQSGLSISATYTTFGDTIEAENINSLQTAIVNVEDYVLANVASGDYVHTSGGTMTGELVMNADINLTAGNIITDVSGTNSIAQTGVPLANVYSDRVVTDFVVAESPLTLSGDSIYLNTVGGVGVVEVDGVLQPATSGTHDLGTLALPWDTTYFNSLGKSIVLASGINLVVLSSGTNDIGQVTVPLDSLYANNIVADTVTSPSIATGLSGVFVHINGDTMTGDLVIASGSSLNAFLIENSAGDLELDALGNIVFSSSFVPTSSGIYNVGSSDNPIDTIFVKNIDGGTISGNFVEKTGDVMLGDLEFPVGTDLSVYNIVSSQVSGDMIMDMGQLFVDADSNIRITVGGSQRFEFGLGANYTSTSVLPNASGTLDLGAVNVPYQAVYADNLFFKNIPSGVTLADVVLDGTITVASGGSIVPEVSGTGSIGSSGSPFGTAYFDNIITSVTSGTYVSKFGDAMTGNLIMTGADIETSAPGTGDIGSLAVPFNAVYANNIESDFVHISGDVMTGPLGVPNINYSGTLVISGNMVNIDGEQLNLESNNGPIVLDASTETQILVNGTPQLAVSSSGSTTYNNIHPDISGTLTIGTPDLPFEAVYADSVINSSGVGVYVEKAGDTMTGDLSGDKALWTLGNTGSTQQIAVVGASGLTLDGGGGDTALTTGAGDITIGGNGGRIDIGSNGSEVRISGMATTAYIGSGSGDVDLHAGGGAVLLRTDSAKGISGTTAGPIHFKSTGSGPIHLEGNTGGSESILIEGGVGSATVILRNNSTAPGIGVQVSGETVKLHSDGGNIETIGDILPAVSGVDDIGSPSFPYARLYVDEVVDTSGASIYVEKAGDTMSGDLLTDASGTNAIGSAALPWEQMFTKTINATNISGLSPINIGSEVNMSSNKLSVETISGSSLDIDSGGNLDIDSAGATTITSTGYFDIHSVSNTLDIYSRDGEAFLAAGYPNFANRNLTLQTYGPSGSVNIRPNLNSDGSDLNLEAGGDVVLRPRMATGSAGNLIIGGSTNHGAGDIIPSGFGAFGTEPNFGTSWRPWPNVFSTNVNVDTISGLSASVDISASDINLNGSVNVNGTLSGSSFVGETKTLNYIIDGGGSVIVSGSAGSIELPYDATPLSWNLIADVSGSLSIDVRRQTYAQWSGVNAVTVADSIVGTEAPDITAGFKNQDTDLTTWSGLSTGDIIDFYVDADPTNITKATLSIQLRKDS